MTCRPASTRIASKPRGDAVTAAKTLILLLLGMVLDLPSMIHVKASQALRVGNAIFPLPPEVVPCAWCMCGYLSIILTRG